MNVKKKMIENKIIGVIDSCENMNQLSTAFNWMHNMYSFIPNKLFCYYIKRSNEMYKEKLDLEKYYNRLKTRRKNG